MRKTILDPDMEDEPAKKNVPLLPYNPYQHLIDQNASKGNCIYCGKLLNKGYVKRHERLHRINEDDYFIKYKYKQ